MSDNKNNQKNIKQDIKEYLEIAVWAALCGLFVFQLHSGCDRDVTTDAPTSNAGHATPAATRGTLHNVRTVEFVNDMRRRAIMHTR